MEFLRAVIDFETRSRCDIRKRGSWNYATDPSTTPMSLHWSVKTKGKRGEKTIRGRWEPERPVPHVLDEAITSGTEVWAFHTFFDHAIWDECLLRLHPEFPPVADDQWRDAMALSAIWGFPLSLKNSAQAIGLGEQKDGLGHKAMMKLCKPRSNGDFWEKPSQEILKFTDEWLPPTSELTDNGPEDPTGLTQLSKKLRKEHPEQFKNQTAARLAIDWVVMFQYGDQDVIVTEQIIDKLPSFPSYELPIWQADQEINRRGLKIDTDLCEGAIRIADDQKCRLNDELHHLTDQTVSAATQIKQLKDWCGEQGSPMETLDKHVVATLVKDEKVPAKVKRALRIRQEVGKSSTSKFNAGLLRADPRDGRARETLMYGGAHTMRWAGRGIQAQNFSRQTIFKKLEDLDDAHLRMNSHSESLANVIRGGDVDELEMFWGDPMRHLSEGVRGMIVADEGYQLGVADFAQIEARVNAWVSREHWKVESFVAYDEGRGPDNYILAKDRMNEMMPALNAERLQGKVAELALGYGGGIGAFQSMASVYGLSLQASDDAEVAEMIDDWYSKNALIVMKLARKWAKIEHEPVPDWAVRRRGPNGRLIVPEQFNATVLTNSSSELLVYLESCAVADLLKLAWRKAHPATVKFWHYLNDAAINAVQNPGEIHEANDIKFIKRNRWLLCRLPSGRFIPYPDPKVGDEIDPDSDRKSKKLSYAGRDPKTGQWSRHRLYGGLLCENICQAIARDLLAESILRCEAEGIRVVLHVHDELIAEIQPEQYPRFEELLTQTPEWAKGCPVAADGFVANRYRK